MALCARAALLLGALQVLALPGAVAQETYAQGSPSGNHSVPLLTANVNVTENTTMQVVSNQTSQISTVKPSSVLPKNVTAATVRPATIKVSTPGVSPHVTPSASKSTPKTSASPNSTQTSASMTTTAHSSLLTSVTVSATTHPTKGKGSKFDAGSFVGGIVLTLGVLSILYIGCKMYYSRRGIRYRSIDEHDAII
ncbi:porimin precursor [Rattus norvegicus]|uniref:Porimin n=3 Tax=Rattus norvegicus TaxID=10116 RepID=PORIM_RAT|nr:porimin precursor [Rattus norvegicus]Q5HZB0.1 RecName: Full=Porimin; AltName: Full=Transmembrane protein 123; Flags: Precursor [Rattus norvegicus]AAH89103.1 Transmembrane protein 123 [Rattus norvegicus]|eukprot:NP_001014227.1 porimin precursor [Rattus norvegicus]